MYETFDENDNSLYIKSVNNNDYPYYSNKTFIDDNIFYNFITNVKKIKFVIKLQMILSRVIKIWYIKNDNYRLVIKNYGLYNIFSNIVYIMSDLENVYKLNRYFYMDSNQNI